MGGAQLQLPPWLGSCPGDFSCKSATCQLFLLIFWVECWKTVLLWGILWQHMSSKGSGGQGGAGEFVWGPAGCQLKMPHLLCPCSPLKWGVGENSVNWAVVFLLPTFSLDGE